MGRRRTHFGQRRLRRAGQGTGQVSNLAIMTIQVKKLGPKSSMHFQSQVFMIFRLRRCSVVNRKKLKNLAAVLQRFRH
jgi:hypothetical protein